MRALRWTAILLAIVVALMQFGWAGPQRGRKKTPKPSKQTLHRKLQTVKTRIQTTRRALKEKRVQETQVSARLEVIEGELGAAQHNLRSTRSQLSDARAKQAEIKGRLDQASAILGKRQSLLSRRLRAGFVQGKVSRVSVLLGSRSTRELLSRGGILRRISAQDSKLYNEYKALKSQYEADKAAQDSVVKEIAVLEAQQRVQAEALYQATNEKSKILEQIQDDKELLLAQLESLEEQSNAITDSIRKLYASPQFKNRLNVRWNGQLALPSAPRTSGYGMRLHPIAKVYKKHTGCDYGMAYGAAIRVAGSGVVIAAGYIRGYGNTVIVDHGSGISTLYAHCSSLSVGVGQNVRQGDVIAAVGSTGYSTGPHLHFEIRRNGAPVNPETFR